jgi:hypothetical protein
MDKLSLHESFRIYLPGLLFCILLYSLFNDSFQDISVVAIPAIFVGFAINVPLLLINRWYFQKVLAPKYKIILNTKQKTFHEHERAIFNQKHQMFKTRLGNELEDVYDVRESGWDFTVYSFLARNYDSADTSSFRLPKSLGVMCFNFFIISLVVPSVLCITAVILKLEISAFQRLISIASIILGALFFFSAKKFLQDALVKQLFFWGSLTFEEYQKMISYYKIQKKCHLEDLLGNERE